MDRSGNSGMQIREIADRYNTVLEQIAAAAISVNRHPDRIRLVVVTKAHPIEVVRAVVEAGAQILGENYVEEALPKIQALANPKVEWHMIGHIQSRKARYICENFAWAHSLDRWKAASKLDRFASEAGVRFPVLLECNVSGEDSKFGFPVWNEDQWPEFLDEVAPILTLPHLEVRGLMTIPPWNPDPGASRPYCVRINRVRDALQKQFPAESWSELSMGMSHDFQVAIQEGATIVRVGTAIVGPRP